MNIFKRIKETFIIIKDIFKTISIKDITIKNIFKTIKDIFKQSGKQTIPWPKKNYYTSIESINWGSKILDWQSRQQKEEGMDYKLAKETNVSFKLLSEINSSANHKIRYERDVDLFATRDYWQTFNSVSIKLQGDCEDQAIYKWGILRCIYGDANVGMCIVKGHCFCCVYETGDPNFWVLDNGYMCHYPVRAQTLFPKQIKDKLLVPLVGFNHIDKWSY